ncbi:MAG: CHC2 zinc finger domain-containing protein [bacterium]
MKIDVESLKNSINIVDVVSQYTDLRKVGKDSYTGLCPNPEHHDTHDGNFYVKEDNQYYKCFSCGFKGDVISFIEEVEGIDFIEAVKLLINDNGLDYEEIKTTNIYIRDNFSVEKIQKAINLLNSREYMNESILEKYATPPKYMIDRGFTKDTLEKFEIGFCSDPTDDLYNRVTIPWRDEKGRLITINGRRVKSSTPRKYKVKKGTNKNILYNINNIKRNDEPLIIVESELDVMWLYQMNYERVVALGGNDIGDRKWHLRSFTNKAILALDRDNGGLRGTKKLAKTLYPLMDVYAVKLPEGSDVGDIESKEQLDKIFDNTKRFKG